MRGDAGRDVRHRPPAGAVRLAVRGLRLPRRPEGLIDQTRWLFTICFLVSLAVCTPHPLVEGHCVARTMIVGAALTLTSTWGHRYRSGTALPLLDVADALATACFAAACPLPSVALGFVFSSVWGQALYGSVARLAASLVLVLTGLAASIPLWTVVPGHGDSVPASSVLGAFPVLTLTTIIARHLADSLFARERAQRRDADLARFGMQLLAATDRGTVYDHAWDAVGSICAASPGLVAAVLRQGQGAARVLRRTEGLTDLPGDLPTLGPGDTLVLPEPAASGPLVRVDSAALESTSGFRGGWRALPVPGTPGTVLLLGHPKALPEDGVLAARTMLSQLGLAVRNTDVREHLTTQASTDHLTGLANRRAFRFALEEALRAGTATAVLFLDLDDFKNVNDALGHAAGDGLLQRVASRLQGCTRPEDLCARLGGDEFAVLLTGDADADDVAERLVRALSSRVLAGGHRMRIGASVGIAPVGDNATCEDILHRADLAMYSAKTAGKNCARRFTVGGQQAGHPGAGAGFGA